MTTRDYHFRDNDNYFDEKVTTTRDLRFYGYDSFCDVEVIID